MPNEYAPPALLELSRRIVAVIPSARLSGILGDASHTYGYHRCRNVLPGDDYSIQLAADKTGDGWAASGLDMSYDAARMKLVTGRLLASAKDPDDPRLDCCREFYGTLDGKTVAGWDTYYGYAATSDDSHLWHVHISFLRRFANDAGAADAVYSVITGEPLAAWRARIGAVMANAEETERTAYNADAWGAGVIQMRDSVFVKTLAGTVESPNELKKTLARIEAKIAELPTPEIDLSKLAAEIIKQLKG